MSGTNAAAVMSKLVGASNVLTGLTGMDGVTVSYDMPAPVPRELVYGGDMGGPVSLAAFQGGSRVKREEQATFSLHFRVYIPGGESSEAAVNRVVAISTLTENYLAANPALDGSVTGLLKVTVDSFTITKFADDEGWTALRTLSLGVHSYLT